MKLLFTGPLLDFSGFAHASRNFLHALVASNKFDLTARALKYDLADNKFEPEPWLNALLKTDLQDVDMAIQMTTCNIEAQPVPGICNGLYTFLESDRLQAAWTQKANEFDFLLVPCKHNAEALMRSGVTKPILVIPPPCDFAEYDKSYAPFKIENAGDRTIFYSICQLSAKKGVDALIKAYLAAFVDTPDDVLLVLKTYINMHDRSNDMATIKNYIAQIKQGCRIPSPKLPPILPITGIMKDDDIHALHKRGHAYVCSSRAEGWGIPAFDALGHGNTLISHMNTGLEGFVRPEHALVYGGMETFFFDMNHPDPRLYTGLEQCFEPSPVQMAFLMRKYHTLRVKAMKNTLTAEDQKEWDAVIQRQENARKATQSFHYENTHQMITPQLEKVMEKWKNGESITFDEAPTGPELACGEADKELRAV
jgi:hypothetical protein